VDRAGRYLLAEASARLAGLLVVGDDVDRSLLCAGRAAVDPHIGTDQVGFHIGSNTLVRFDQAASPLFANLAVIEDFLLLRGVRIGLRNLVLETLIKRLVLSLSDELGVTLRR
jgi:hypothetical protein